MQFKTDQACHQGQEGLGSEEQRELRQEEGGSGLAAVIQAQVVEQDTQVRVRYRWRVEGAFSVIKQRI